MTTRIFSRAFLPKHVAQDFARTLCSKPPPYEPPARKATPILSPPPNAPSFEMAELTGRLADIVGATNFAEDQGNREKLLGLLSKSQGDMHDKTLGEGLQVAWVRLSDEKIREKYINFMFSVRFGKILEDLDTLAVWVAYMHNKMNEVHDYKSPLVIVTAMVDEIILKRRTIRSDMDIKIIGYVSWVGRSSMEVTMQMQQQQQSSKQRFETTLEARFLMVARDPFNRGSAFVAPLRPEGKDEELIFLEGERRQILRHREGIKSLFKESPSAEESRLIHSMFLETMDEKSKMFSVRYKPENSVWMHSTMLKNVLINHPQNRNLYNKIFGGYLMGQAFELAWTNAVRYAKKLPVMIAIDDIVFQRPVEIGTLLFLSSVIVFTKNSYMQIRVHAEVSQPTEAKSETSNIFYFTFSTQQDERVPVVMPKTYAEYMMFLDGKRHFEAIMSSLSDGDGEKAELVS